MRYGGSGVIFGGLGQEMNTDDLGALGRFLGAPPAAMEAFLAQLSAFGLKKTARLLLESLEAKDWKVRRAAAVLMTPMLERFGTGEKAVSGSTTQRPQPGSESVKTKDSAD